MATRTSIIIASAGNLTPPTWNDAEIQNIARDLMITPGGVTNVATNNLQVTELPAPTNKVRVQAGVSYISITKNGYTYKVRMENLAVFDITIAANASGNPRIDRIVARIDTAAEPDVNAANIGLLEVVQGTPAGSPSAPATPANAISLATVAVANGAVTFLNANITDTRQLCYIDGKYVLIGTDQITAAMIAASAVGSSEIAAGAVLGDKLEGGSASPGNTKYYGTNGSGTRGFYDLLPSDLISSMTAGETLADGNPVGFDAFGKVKKAFKLWESTETQFAAANVSVLSVCRVDAHKFACIYTDGTNTKGVVCSFTEQGVATFGTAQTLWAYSALVTAATQMDVGKVVFGSYQSVTAYNVMVCTVSGTVFTLGTPATLFSGSVASPEITLCAMNTTECFAGYANASTLTAECKYFSVATTTITLGTTSTPSISNANGSIMRSVKCSSSVGAWTLSTGTGTRTTWVIPFFVNSNNYALGSSVQLNQLTSNGAEVVMDFVVNPLVATEGILVMVYNDTITGGINGNNIVFSHFNLSTHVITLGTRSPLFGASLEAGTNYSNTVMTNPMFYRIAGNFFLLASADRGISIIRVNIIHGAGNASFCNLERVYMPLAFQQTYTNLWIAPETTGFSRFFIGAIRSNIGKGYYAEFINNFAGIAQEAQSWNTAIKVMVRGNDNAQSGLLPGSRMYAVNGALSPTDTYGEDSFAGVATSATQIQVQ